MAIGHEDESPKQNYSSNLRCWDADPTMGPDRNVQDGQKSPSSHKKEALKSNRRNRNIDGGWAWVALFAAFFIQLIVIGAIMSMGIFFTELTQEFGRDATASRATSWLLSTSFGTNAIIGPFGGIMANRFGYSFTMSFGAGIASIGFFISCFARSFWLLFFSFGILTGAGLGLAMAPGFGVIAFYFEKRKNLATTLVTLSVGVGLMVFAPLERYLIGLYTWRGASLVLSGISLNVIPLSCLLTHRKKTSSSSFTQNADLSLFSKISFYLLMVNFFLMAGYNIWNIAGVRYAVLNCGVAESDSPWLLSLHGSLNIAGRLSALAFACHPATASNTFRWTAFQFFTLAGGLCLVFFGFSSSFLGLSIWSAGIGYFIGGRYALLPALQIDLFTAKRFTTSFAYGACILGVGTFLLPQFGEWIADRTSTPGAPFYLAGACIVTACGFTIPLQSCLPTSKTVKIDGKKGEKDPR